MVTKDRIQAIKQMIANGKEMTVLNLSGILQVTEGTIRRDLERLEDEGFLIRTYDDAVLNIAMSTGNIYFYKRAPSFYEEKQLIARRILSFTGNRTTMTVDSGGTVMELLKLLQNRSDLTLLTNLAETIYVLAQSEIKVVSIGRELNKSTLSLQGRITREIINRYHINIIVMNCKDLDINNGALDSNEAEAEVKKAMIRQATEVALLADHSKSDRRAFIQLTDSSHINYIMTDKSPGVEWIAFCKDNNIRLMW